MARQQTEGYWVTRTYEAGNVGEKTKFFVPGTRPTGKLRRKDADAIRKQAQNAQNAQKTLARLINANFGPEDYLLGLDYSEQGMERMLAWGREHGLAIDTADETIQRDAVWESASHALDTCIRRVKYRLKKQGIELKAVYCTSDMDGQTEEPVRVHHHLVINGAARGAFVSAWEELGMGSVDWSGLWENQIDRMPIAEYLLRQVRRIPDAKKYRSTRNLVRPKPKDRVALTDAEIRVPKGCNLLFRQEYKPGAPQYIRYSMPRKGLPPGDGA